MIEIKVGLETKVGTIELRTTDNYLYSEDIDIGKIKLELESGNENLSYKIVPLSIAGIYEAYVTLKEINFGNMKLTFDDVEIKQFYLSTGGTTMACYLVLEKPELFNLTVEQDPREHYYDYLGDFIEGHLEFNFFILNTFYHKLTNEDYQNNYVDIYSLQFGNDAANFFTCKYNTTIEAYVFRDNINFTSGKYTWIFFMRDASCNNHYYITYDRGRVQSSISIENSYFTLLKNEVNISEYSYVDVFLKDINNNFMGITSGKLEELKNNIIVKAIDTDTKKVYTFDHNQITDQYAIRFQDK